MAIIKPFRGIRYNPNRITTMADVISPPYDVISNGEQDALHDQSPYNVIRLELGQRYSGDDMADNPHTRAKHYLNSWLQNGTLIQEDAPAIYLTATEFATRRGRLTRWGLLVSVGLEPFEKGCILPHERTYATVKSERLALMQACQANLSPIFSFFSDDRAIMPEIIDHAQSTEPVVAFEDASGIHHRLWAIKEPDMHNMVAAKLEPQTLFIADGHHRYETALAYRDGLSAREGALPADHPANLTLMYLSSIQDPGLIIRPAHRLLPSVAADVRGRFLERARTHFDVVPAQDNLLPDMAFKTLLERLDQTQPGAALIVAQRDTAEPYLLELKPGAKTKIYPEKTPGVLKDIDVILLSEFIFPELLELSPSQLDDVDCVHYNHDAHRAMEGVKGGDYDMAFIIKPTPISAVQKIAAAGQVMPRKSTYFSPKVSTGLVIHSIAPDRG